MPLMAVWAVCGVRQVCLKYAFTSKEDLFLILDLMRGGVCTCGSREEDMASAVQ